MSYDHLYRHVFRPEDPKELSKGLKIISDILKIPIEKQGLWVMTQSGDFEGKYGDYYPQIRLLVLTEDAKNQATLKPSPDYKLNIYKSDDVSPEETTKTGSSLSDDIDDDFWSDFGKISGTDPDDDDSFLSDIEGDIENQYNDEFYDKVDELIYHGLPEKYIESVLDKDITIANPDFYKKLPEHFFKALTSAKFNIRLGSLYAEAMNDNGYAACQSKLRPDELIKIFDDYLNFFSKEDTFTNTENFAIDTPQYVIYFHMDKRGDYSHQLRQINKYIYNDNSKGILPFYDSRNKMALIPYDNWASILDNKPVLMFGYENETVPTIGRQVFNSFLGEYNASGTDSQGNFSLSLADLRFDFPV